MARENEGRQIEARGAAHLRAPREVEHGHQLQTPLRKATSSRGTRHLWGSREHRIRGRRAVPPVAEPTSQLRLPSDMRVRPKKAARPGNRALACTLPLEQVLALAPARLAQTERQRNLWIRRQTSASSRPRIGCTR